MDKHEAIEPNFSAPRLRPYLERAQGNHRHALELYRWNATLAAAFFVDLGHLEVGLRNAVDSRMTARHQTKGLPGTWLDDPAGELGRDPQGTKHRQPYRDIHGARHRVRQNGKALTHGQVLSETPFGLWHQLVSKRWTPLWPDLADAFRYAPSRSRELVAQPVGDLRDLRNRVGHHHRIWPLPCEQLHAQLLAVARYIDPNLASWITGGSAVPAVLAARPPALL